jgi:hypothetical protein
MKKILLLLITLLSGTVCQGMEILFVNPYKAPKNPISNPIDLINTPIHFITTDHVECILRYQDTLGLIGGQPYELTLPNGTKKKVMLSRNIKQGIKNYVEGKQLHPNAKADSTNSVNPKKRPLTHPARPGARWNAKKQKSMSIPADKEVSVNPKIQQDIKDSAREITPQPRAPKSTHHSARSVARWNSKWIGAAGAVAVIGLLGWYYRAYLARGSFNWS